MFKKKEKNNHSLLRKSSKSLDVLFQRIFVISYKIRCKSKSCDEMPKSICTIINNGMTSYDCSFIVPNFYLKLFCFI